MPDGTDVCGSGGFSSTYCHVASTDGVHVESSAREALPKPHLLIEEEAYIVICMISLMKREGEEKEAIEKGRQGGLHIYNDLNYLEGRRPIKSPNMTGRLAHACTPHTHSHTHTATHKIYLSLGCFLPAPPPLPPPPLPLLRGSAAGAPSRPPSRAAGFLRRAFFGGSLNLVSRAAEEAAAGLALSATPCPRLPEADSSDALKTMLQRAVEEKLVAIS